jgi:hypothetical protein
MLPMKREKRGSKGLPAGPGGVLGNCPHQRKSRNCCKKIAASRREETNQKTYKEMRAAMGILTARAD